MAKILKYLLYYSTSLSSGRTDFYTVDNKPGISFDWSDIADEDEESVNYNSWLILDYIDRGYYCLITVPGGEDEGDSDPGGGGEPEGPPVTTVVIVTPT